MDNFLTLIRRLRGPNFKVPESVLALDPGETTGWAFFRDGEMRALGQVVGDTESPGHSARILMSMVETQQPEWVVVEGYRIYARKAQQHVWSSLFTVRLIGQIELICLLQGIPLVQQMASTKRFSSQEKLERWGLYRRGVPHAMDAVRHACYFLLFNKQLEGEE